MQSKGEPLSQDQVWNVARKPIVGYTLTRGESKDTYPSKTLSSLGTVRPPDRSKDILVVDCLIALLLRLSFFVLSRP